MNGYANVVMLVGEQGIGKSRLLQEFVNQASREGALVLRGGASESEGMPPYLPFLEALGRYIREAPLDQLREQVEPVPHILVNILPELTTRLGELSAVYSLPPEQMRLRLYEAVGLFVQKISSPCGLVFAFDDLHWADSASLDLLCHIVRTQPDARLLFLVACSEGEIEPDSALQRTVAKLVQQRILTRVEVESLSAEEIGALACSYLGGAVSHAVSQLMFIQSEGNPFFAEELARGWVEKGEIVWRNGVWVAAAPLEHALPQTIVGVLRRRFARLSPDIVDHLRVASIIGRAFDLSLLANIERSEAEVLEEDLLEAASAGLIRSDRVGIFTFSHDKIRECLYAEVSTLRRRRLHEEIGRILEESYGPENAGNVYQLAELAFHFSRSGDRERGLKYSLLAAERAVQYSAFKEAVTYYYLALELLHKDDTRRADVLLGLGEAALLADLESEAVFAFGEALTLFSRSGGREDAARAAHGLARTQWRQESLQAARGTFEHALALLGDMQSAVKVRVLVDLATLLTSDMDHQVEGMTYAQRALVMALRLGDHTLEAAANRAVAGKLYTPGNDIIFASHSLERALELAEASGDPSEAGECCFSLARAYYWSSEIERSHVVSCRMIELIERSRQPYQLRNALPWLALLHTAKGEWEEAGRAIERALPVVEHLSSAFPSDFLRQVRGFLAYQREDYATAEREFRATMADQQASPDRLMFFPGLYGLTLVALGKREEAYSCVGQLEKLLSELPAGSLPTAPIMVCLALMAIALRDYERAANLYMVIKAFRGQYHWFLVDRVLGLLATLLKDWRMAEEYLTSAKETARRVGLRPELARTLLAYADFEAARGGRGSSARAADSLALAVSLFDELQLAVAAAHVRNRLQALSHRAFPSDPLPADLTRGEARVLKLAATGRSNRQIARQLGISEKTVANHLTHIFEKTGSENRAAATAFAIRHGLA